MKIEKIELKSSLSPPRSNMHTANGFTKTMLMNFMIMMKLSDILKFLNWLTMNERDREFVLGFRIIKNYNEKIFLCIFFSKKKKKKREIKLISFLCCIYVHSNEFAGWLVDCESITNLRRRQSRLCCCRAKHVK